MCSSSYFGRVQLGESSNLAKHAGLKGFKKVAEYKQLLRQKLLEEVNEYMESGNSEELADILEVLTALAGTCGLSINDLMELAEKKRQDRGGFEERIVLLSVDD